jgi:hypothetical protein
MYVVCSGGKHLQCVPEIIIHHGIEKPHALDLAQRDRAHPLGAKQVESVDFYVPRDLGFHADNDARKQGRLLELKRDLDLLAARLVENFAEGRIAGQVERKTMERFVEGIGTVVADGADLAAAHILQHKAFQQVVDVRNGERQIDAGRILHFAFALKIADAAAEEDDLGDRQGAGRNPVGFGGWRSGRLGRRGRDVPGDGSNHGERNCERDEKQPAVHGGVLWSE